MAEVRRRSSRRSDEVQTRQRHPMTGTPCEVPVPRKVSFMQTKIVKIWRLRTRAGKILRTDFRIRRKTGYEKTERQGGAVHGKRAERRPQKSGQIVSREETRNRQPEKADKSSAGKSRQIVSREKRAKHYPKGSGKPKAGGASAGEKAEHSTKHPSAGTGGESEKSRRKNPAAFLHFRTAGGTPGDQ